MPKRSEAKPKPPNDAQQPKPAVLDPFNVPVQFVDNVLHLSAGALGIANIVLGTWHVEPGPNGEAAPPHIRVAARLRMSLPFVKAVRDSLDRQLLATTPTEGGEQ
jgi:hypothetical protein